MTAQELWNRFCREDHFDPGTLYKTWALCGGAPPAGRPAAGAYSVLLYENGQAAGSLQNTKISPVPFDQVPASHAYKEGEDPRVLVAWRETRRRAFAADCRAAGLPFDEAGLCVLEEFRLVCAP